MPTKSETTSFEEASTSAGVRPAPVPPRSSTQTYDHILDDHTVFMKSPVDESVGQAPGSAFKAVWGPKGWTQTTQEAFLEFSEGIMQQHTARYEAGIAPLPEDVPEAQSVINNPGEQHVAGDTGSVV